MSALNNIRLKEIPLDNCLISSYLNFKSLMILYRRRSRIAIRRRVGFFIKESNVFYSKLICNLAELLDIREYPRKDIIN